MKKKKYVLDASVVINSLIEKDSKLRQLCAKIVGYCERDDVVILAPDALKQEVANVLLLKLKDIELAEHYFEIFTQLNITYVRVTDTQLLKALEIASAVHDTVYDSTYHALALSRSATFLTCDQKYVERAKGWGGVKVVK